jgi:hypothetical protein
VLVEAELRIEASLLQLHALKGHREHPRLEAHERSAGRAEISGGFPDERERRGREQLVERLIAGQHAARQDLHLRHRIQHLGHVDLLDQEVRILERRFERRVQRVEIGRHHVDRADQVDDAAFPARFPAEGLGLGCVRNGRAGSRDGDDAQREGAAPDQLAGALRHTSV